MDKYKTTDGTEIELNSDIEQLRIEHILQKHREAWVITHQWPYLSIDLAFIQTKIANLTNFSVFSNGQLWQNLR